TGESEQNVQFLSNYLEHDNDRIKNIAFNEIHLIYENKNVLWYNDEEKSSNH
ncbi:unnamed protein product, partial [marine sediment metagenome]